MGACFVSPGVCAGHAVVVEVSPDIHICGFCKQQYNNFEIFLAHKQNGCSLPTSDTSATTATTTTLTGKKKKKLYFWFCCQLFACRLDLQSCTYTVMFSFCSRFQHWVCFRGNLPDLCHERCQKDPDQSTENTFQKIKTFPDFKETQLLFLRLVPLSIYDCNTFLLFQLPCRENSTSCPRLLAVIYLGRF